jgi:predicted nucleic acid-binding protein
MVVELSGRGGPLCPPAESHLSSLLSSVIIAGHAIAAGYVLVTNNTREFSRVDGLELEDWLQL